MLRVVFFISVSRLLLISALHAAEPPPVPEHEVRLAGGRVATYSIHFDRNSLRDSVRVPGALIGLTSAGTLLRCELPAVRLTSEHIGPEEVTCLGRGEGAAVLAGLADGRVCRVDPESLGLNEVARIDPTPRWVGWAPAIGDRAAGLVVVARRTKSVERYGRRFHVPFSVAHDLATGKTFTLDDNATAFLLDRAGRLWLGSDHGEWGGRVTRVDLGSGNVTQLKPPHVARPFAHDFWEGVYGFIELRDGQVWAFGGTSHMGIHAGAITRIDDGDPRALLAFEGPLRAQGDEPDPDRPRMPLTQIVEERDGLFVVSYSDVFRVDKALKAWKRVATLEIQYRWGRPDAVGAYPSVCAVNPAGPEGGPYAFATVADGYVLVEGGKVTSRALPGQLGVSEAYRLENSSAGTLVFGERDEAPWKLGPQGWERLDMAPPFEANPLDDFAENMEAWFETRVLVGPGGTLFTVSGTGAPGTRTTARWEHGKAIRLGREVSELDPSGCFITPDGTLWNTSLAGLGRFEHGRWEIRAQRDCPMDALRALDRPGPPWLLLDDRDPALWRIDHGPKGGNPWLSPVKLEENGAVLAVHDGIPWSDGTVLLATGAGLRTFSLDTLKLLPVDIPQPPKPATALARDGVGRVWLGNAEGLWLSKPGANAAESFDGVPWLNHRAVYALAPDPQHADGVVAALGERGVVFIRIP